MELTREFLHEVFIEKKMSMRSIAEKYKVDRSRLSKALKSIGYTKEIQLNSFKFNKQQIDLMVGSVLGDGTFNFEGSNYRFSVRHAENQKGYLEFKHSLLYELCKQKEINSNNWNASHSDNAQLMYYFNTRALPIFKKYAEMSILEAIDNLNENSFVIWLMDDGSLHKKGNCKYYTLSVKRFTKEQSAYLINKLKEKFNLTCTMNLHKNTEYESGHLYFPVTNTESIKQMILSSDFGETLSSVMEYKIPD